MSEEVLTTTEVMKYLKITRPTLLKFIKEKKIKAFKVGQKYRIFKKELDRYIEEQNS